MARAHLSEDSLVVRFSAGEKIAGVLRDIDMPLSTVLSASVEPDGLSAATGMRAPGLAVPGYNKIGTWRSRGRRTLVLCAEAVLLSAFGLRNTATPTSSLTWTTPSTWRGH
jgi:hypothetical protein